MANLIPKGSQRVEEQGSYSTVYEYRGRILKLFYPEEDCAYNDFLKAVKRIKNKYFPKIYSVKYHEEIDGTLIKVSMEKLKILAEYPLYKQRYFLRKLGVPKEAVDKINHHERVFFILKREFFKLNPKCPELKKAINIIKELCEVWNFDLHSYNIMIRNNREIVFADPIYE